MNHLHYIDPGTGSMLFTILISIVSSLMFFWKKFYLKLKFLAGGGRVSQEKDYLPYVIFSDSRRYWNVFGPICREFERRKIRLEYLTASPDDPALSEHFEYVHCQFIGENNRAFARLNMLNAGILLSTIPGLEVYQWKRSKNVEWYAHVFHAVDEGTGYRMFGMDYYDAILLTGAFQEYYIRKLEELRGLPAKELLVAGSTYMDALKEKLDACSAGILKENAMQENGLAAHIEEVKKEGASEAPLTVLLAPSWGESGILSRYGAKILRALSETGYRIVVRPHPQSMISEREMMEGLQREFPEGENFHWNFDNDNFGALREADLMITDFSGIIFDYTLVFGKPILYADTSVDSAPYDAAWIDEPMWRFEVLKDLGEPLLEEDFPNMKDRIDSLVKGHAKDGARERVRDEAWQCIGESARRTVDYMVSKYQQLHARTEGA